MVIEYRDYCKTDYDSYASFSAENFGKEAYQNSFDYLEWLYGDAKKSFSVAKKNGKIIGIEHNFKAPIFINGKLILATVLHDLMIDQKHRGKCGFRLMYDSLKRDDYLVLPGSVGRLSRTYGRLGSIKFDSYWYRKFQIPKNIFRLISQNRFLDYKKMANKNGLILGHNKEVDSKCFQKTLKTFKNFDWFPDYFKWRFFHKYSPLTFYVSDEYGNNAVLFVIGKRGRLPYVRIFYVRCQTDEIQIKIIRFIELITARIGVPVILYSSYEQQPSKKLGYSIYGASPVSYVYSKLRKDEFETVVPSFCCDIGFDGLNLIRN
jgi:hypothetical protein